MCLCPVFRTFRFGGQWQKSLSSVERIKVENCRSRMLFPRFSHVILKLDPRLFVHLFLRCFAFRRRVRFASCASGFGSRWRSASCRTPWGSAYCLPVYQLGVLHSVETRPCKLANLGALALGVGAASIQARMENFAYRNQKCIPQRRHWGSKGSFAVVVEGSLC